MDWTLAFEQASNFWEESLQNLICSHEERIDTTKIHELILDPRALSPQPRSVASSEFSEQNSSINEIIEWTLEDDANLMKLVSQHNYDWKIIAKAFPKYSKNNLLKR